MPTRNNDRTVEEILALYEDGRRDFSNITLVEGDFTSVRLQDVDFSGANLSASYFAEVVLERVRFDGTTLTSTEWYDSTVEDCSFQRALLDFSEVSWSEWDRNDFTGSNFDVTLFREVGFGEGIFTDARLDSTVLIGCDIRSLCRANESLIHTGSSYVDYSTVTKSILAPNLKDFLLRTGMPAIFVDYTVECALAVDNPALSRMMQSTFISYGGPDTLFARKLYEALHQNGVKVFFFPEHAIPGKRLHRIMREGVNQHDRVVLICSEASLTRPGVLNEIEETLAREARDGGETYLIPVRLDDFVFSGWSPTRPDIAQAIKDRVVADFTGAVTDDNIFNSGLLRLLTALRR